MNTLELQTVDDFEIGDLVRVEYVQSVEHEKYLHKLCRVSEKIINKLSSRGDVTSWLVVTGRQGGCGYLPQRLRLIKRA